MIFGWKQPPDPDSERGAVIGALSHSLKLAGSAASGLTARDGKGGQTREVGRVLPTFQSKEGHSLPLPTKETFPQHRAFLLQVAQLTEFEGFHTCQGHVLRTMEKRRRGFLTAG